MEKKGDTVTVSLAANTDQGVPQVISDVNCLLWAIGRDANLVDLGLDKTGECLPSLQFHSPQDAPAPISSPHRCYSGPKRLHFCG